MNIKVGVIFLYCLINTRVFFAQPHFDWVKELESSHRSVSDLKVDAAGNVYILGSFTYSMDFDPSVSSHTLYADPGSLFVLKLNSLGVFLWVKQIGATQGFAAIQASEISLDDAGNIYVLGHVDKGIFDLDPGVGTQTFSPIGNSAGFVLQLDFNGAYKWAGLLEGNVYPTSVATNSIGEIFIAGNYEGFADFDFSAATNSFVSGHDQMYSYYNPFLIKLLTNKNLSWVRCLTSNEGHGSNKKVVVKDGNFIHWIGEMGTGTDLDPGPTVFTSTTDGSYIISLDSAGKLKNKLIFYKSKVSDMISTVDGMIIASTFAGTCDIDPGPNAFILTAAGNSFQADAIFFKLDSLNNFLWAKQISKIGQGSIGGIKVHTDHQNFNYLTLNFVGTYDFDPSPANYTLTSTNVQYGWVHMAYGCYDGAGNFLWANSDGPLGLDGTPGSVTSSGDIYSAGVVMGNFDADPGAGTYSPGTQNIFIKKLSDCSGVEKPNLTVSASSSVICPGKSVILTASGGASYIWSHDLPLSSSVIVYPEVSTLYSVTAFGNGSCIATELIYIETGACVDISEYMGMEDTVYPNPSTGTITLITKAGGKLEISDLLGKILLEKKVESSATILNLNDLPAGVYNLRVYKDGVVLTTKKLVKK